MEITIKGKFQDLLNVLQRIAPECNGKFSEDDNIVIGTDDYLYDCSPEYSTARTFVSDDGISCKGTRKTNLKNGELIPGDEIIISEFPCIYLGGGLCVTKENILYTKDYRYDMTYPEALQELNHIKRITGLDWHLPSQDHDGEKIMNYISKYSKNLFIQYHWMYRESFDPYKLDNFCSVVRINGDEIVGDSYKSSDYHFLRLYLDIDKKYWRL
jgi:hypothetical protein